MALLRRPHPLHKACICFRCIWRRVHWRFWSSLLRYSNDSVCQSLMSSLYEDSQIAAGQTSNYAFDIEDSEAFVSATQSSQAIPDSYAVTSRVPLPSAPYASIPPGERAVHDKLKPSLAATFPNLHRFYDSNSRAIAHVAWDFVSAEEVWAIVTCKLLGAGRIETMAWFKHAAMSHVHSLLSKYVSMNHDQAVKDKVTFPFSLHPFILTPLLSGPDTWMWRPAHGLSCNSSKHASSLESCSPLGSKCKRITKQTLLRSFLDSSLMHQRCKSTRVVWLLS